MYPDCFYTLLSHTPTSFNDMFSGMNVLFNWLVVNNWTTQTSGMEHATGNKWIVRLFFLSFYLLGVIGISNVITSFIISAFFQQLKTLEGGQLKKENDAEERADSGSSPVFDTRSDTSASTANGADTDTFSNGTSTAYVALCYMHKMSLHNMMSTYIL